MWLLNKISSFSEGIADRIVNLTQTMGSISSAVDSIVTRTTAAAEAVMTDVRESVQENIQRLEDAVFSEPPVYDPELVEIFTDLAGTFLKQASDSEEVPHSIVADEDSVEITDRIECSTGVDERKKAPTFVKRMKDAAIEAAKRLIMPQFERYLRMDNNTEHASESVKQMVSDIFENLEDSYLQQACEKVLEWFQEELEKAALTSKEESMLKFGVDFLNPLKNPKVYNYLKKQMQPALVLVFQECLNEGKRLQTLDPALANLDDKALVLLGAAAMATFLGQELLEDKQPEEILEALGEKFPGFKNIKLPKALLVPALDFIKNKALISGSEFFTPLKALTSQLPEIHQDLIDAWGQETSDPKLSKMAKPIEGLVTIASSAVKNLLTERGADSIAHKAVKHVNEFGFNIEEMQIENVLSAIATTDLPEIKNIRDGIEIYTEATVKELFVRLGKKVKEEDHTVLDLVQNVVMRLGAYMDGRDFTGVEAACDPEFYHKFTLDLLKTLGLEGPDDLFFLPEPIRDVVWKKLSADMIENMLKEVMEDIFNPHFIREQIVNALKNKPATAETVSVENEEGVEVPTCLNLQEHTRAVATGEAFSKIYESFVDQFLGKQNPLRLALKTETVSRRVGMGMSEAVTKGLMDLCGDATGKPSLMNLLINVLNGVDLSPSNKTSPQEISPEKQVKICKAKVAEARTQITEAEDLMARLGESDVSYLEAKNAVGAAKAQLDIYEHQLEGAESMLKKKQEGIRAEMQALIQEVSKEKAETFVENLWNGIFASFSNSVRRMYFASFADKLIQAFQKVGSFVFLEILKPVFAGMTVRGAKKAARKLDLCLERNEETLRMLSYYTLREVQQIYLTGPATSGVRGAPRREQSVDQVQDFQDLWDDLYGDGNFEEEEVVEGTPQDVEVVVEDTPQEVEVVDEEAPQPIRWEPSLLDPERMIPVYVVNPDVRLQGTLDFSLLHGIRV